jgi:hypothetical protein
MTITLGRQGREGRDLTCVYYALTALTASMAVAPGKPAERGLKRLHPPPRSGPELSAHRRGCLGGLRPRLRRSRQGKARPQRSPHTSPLYEAGGLSSLPPVGGGAGDADRRRGRVYRADAGDDLATGSTWAPTVTTRMARSPSSIPLFF